MRNFTTDKSDCLYILIGAVEKYTQEKYTLYEVQLESNGKELGIISLPNSETYPVAGEIMIPKWLLDDRQEKNKVKYLTEIHIK